MPLTDEESMDRVNPYVQHDFFMPGTSRQLIDFAEHEAPTEEEFKDDYRSPMCDYGVMVAGRIGRTDVCPLSRELYPGRNIQYDEESLAVSRENNPNKIHNQKVMNNMVGAGILLLLVAAL